MSRILGGAAKKALGVCLALVGLLTGCAIKDQLRFPLDYIDGQEASFRMETAREALPAYLRMGAYFERWGQFGDAAIAYSSAVNSANTLGRLQDALDASQKAVAMAERSGNADHLAVALSHLGWTQIRLGALKKAIPLFERCRVAARRADSFMPEASCHRGLSTVYRWTGEGKKALEYSKTAVEIVDTGIKLKSSQRSRRMLAHVERVYGNMLGGLGWSHIALRQFDGARAAFQRQLEVGNRLRIPLLVADAHQGLGAVAYRQQEFPTAVGHLEEAVRVSPRPGFVAGTQELLGRVYRAMGKPAEAEAALRTAVADIEDLRGLLESEALRESFFAARVDAYELLMLTLLDQGKTGEAFDVSERARARAFLDLLGNRVTFTRGRNEALIAEERSLRERISALRAMPEDSPALQKEMALAREAYQAFLQRVRRVDREQAALMRVEPLTLPQVQALLPEGSVLLEYFVTGEETILWTVDRPTVSVVRLPFSRQVLAQRVQDFREVIASRGQYAETRAMAQALFNDLVRPALQGRTPKEILIVPHAVLHYLPFQALMSEPERFLIQNAPIYYYSSASLIQFTRAKLQAEAPSALAVGNPDLEDPTLALRYAEREARTVADLFADSTLLTRQGATKASSRELSPRYRILHFATHAELNEEDPLGSALRLTPSGSDDGRLEVQEVFGLTLQANLVVLSACETHLGKLKKGDELTGLTRAFIYAGTPSIITTLWQVSDRASYELMRLFYRNLKAGLNKAEALQQAQIATMERHADPYYWAAYMLTGEGR